jgi:hypothetical protein
MMQLFPFVLVLFMLGEVGLVLFAAAETTIKSVVRRAANFFACSSGKGAVLY